MAYFFHLTMTKTKQTKGRRSRKTGNNQSQLKRNLDLNTQDAHLRESTADSLTWNLSSGAYPRFGRISRFDNSTFNVIQMSAPVTLFTTSVTVPSNGVYSFTATNSVSQFSSWSAVFDQYRFMEVEVWVTCEAQPSVIFNGSQNLYSVIDYDDASGLSTVAGALAYSNVIAAPLSNGQYRKFKPHIAVAAYSGAFTSFKNEKAPWIDVASPNVQHYGLKVVSDVTAAAVPIKMFSRTWIQFRNVF